MSDRRFDGDRREGGPSLLGDAPNWLRWSMGFIERIGFPIAVAGYCAYLLLKTIPANTSAMRDVSTAMFEVKNSFTEQALKASNQNEEIIRRLRGLDRGR